LELTHDIPDISPRGILGALEEPRRSTGMVIGCADLVAPSFLDGLRGAECRHRLQERIVERNRDGEPFRKKAAEPIGGLLRLVVTVLVEPDNDLPNVSPKHAENVGVDFASVDRTGPMLFKE
jgi:hypothetical protein